MNEVEKTFKVWLNEVKRAFSDLENPEIDYWQMVSENPLAVAHIDFDENQPFGREEREHLVLGLDEVKVLIKEQFGPTGDRLLLVEKKIKYLQDATIRQNKTDWKNIAISTTISIAYDLSLSPEKQALLMGLFSKIWAAVQALPQGLS